MQQLPLGIRLRDSSVFASYFPGRNREAVTALKALLAGQHPLSAWLWGGAAVGKTHLLQALCARAGHLGESATYIPVAALASYGPEILAGCGELSWVCLDDCDAVMADRQWVHALFKLYQELEDNHGHLIIATTAPPAEFWLPLKDLDSRLSAGLVFNLEALDAEEQLAALKLHATQRGLELPEDTARYLMRRLPEGMVALCAFLDRLDAAALAARRRLTIPFVKTVLLGETRVD
jgi:DnaA-homolog protein